jgi:hypothetical protein
VKTTTTILSLILLFPLTSFGQDFATRVKSAYELNDKNFELDCYYIRSQDFKLINPKAKTIRSANQLSREFILETSTTSIPMTFTVTRSESSIDYSVILNKVHESKNKLKLRQFYIAPIADQNFARQFETSKINCHVNFADAEPVALSDGDYHFNVHPHTIYDWQNKLKAPIEAYLNNPQYESMIFLESNNDRGNAVDLHGFFNGQDPKLSASTLKSDLQNVPTETPMIVSPSGNNRFKMAADSLVNITFSGGNHNYCIWNSTRQVLMGLMKSKSEARINFFYDTKAIVAQQRGMEGLNINFPRKAVNKSNLLSDLLSDQAFQSGYHFSYLIFFRNYFAQEYAGMYRTFKVIYDAPGYSETFIMNGLGTKDLEVSFNYQ